MNRALFVQSPSPPGTTFWFQAVIDVNHRPFDSRYACHLHLGPPGIPDGPPCRSWQGQWMWCRGVGDRTMLTPQCSGLSILGERNKTPQCPTLRKKKGKVTCRLNAQPCGLPTTTSQQHLLGQRGSLQRSCTTAPRVHLHTKSLLVPGPNGSERASQGVCTALDARFCSCRICMGHSTDGQGRRHEPQTCA